MGVNPNYCFYAKIVVTFIKGNSTSLMPLNCTLKLLFLHSMIQRIYLHFYLSLKLYTGFQCFSQHKDILFKLKNF